VCVCWVMQSTEVVQVLTAGGGVVVACCWVWAFFIAVNVVGACAKLRMATVSFVMSVRPASACNNLASTGRIFMKFDI
jgi:hypothetical protein